MVDDITQTSTLIEANGGRIVRALNEEELEWYAHFADPDGNVLGLYQQRER
jgi:predicted enzyme related to lactoylglutathione lyase